MPVDLTDRVMVITGASSGIGRATALACARAGMDLVVNARREDRLRTLAQEIERLGRRCEIVSGDVTDPATSERLLDRAEASFGGFYAVFANAGYGAEVATLHMRNEEVRRMFDVNFFASLDLVRRAARRLLDQKRRGHLMMCSSCVAKFTMPYYAAYSSTKAAQNHFCRSLRLELEDDGIEVSSVHPVTTTTEFFRVVASNTPVAEDEVTIPDHTPRLFVQRPERVARAVVRCLKRPRPEVWTSFIVRFSAGLMTVFPGLLDLSMRKQARQHREALESPGKESLTTECHGEPRREEIS